MIFGRGGVLDPIVEHVGSEKGFGVVLMIMLSVTTAWSVSGGTTSTDIDAFTAAVNILKNVLTLAAVASIVVLAGNAIKLARSRGSEGLGSVLKSFIVAVVLSTATIGGMSALGVSGSVV